MAEEVALRLIKQFSWPGDIILDPWNGSGTVTCAAAKLNRQYIGIEINPSYCRIAKERTDKATRVKTKVG
jgi:site-specific DNA-methyltransferase (adenine-specific)